VVPVAAIASGGWSAWPFAALGGAGLLLLWWHIRCGIYVSGSGVRVIRYFGSEVLPWDQLVAVEVSSDDVLRGGAYPTRFSGRPQIMFRTTSGGVIRTEIYRGFTGRRNDNWLRPKKFDRLVARLRELHTQEQQDRQDSPP
jgi:hypothetical protein